MWIVIKRKKEETLTRQVYRQIRDKILSCELQPGEKLPSSRELSELLQVSRNVILEAYELLELEGYLITKPQSGTFIAVGASFAIQPPASKPEAISAVTDPAVDNCIDLRSGIPALELLPLKKWTRYQNELLLQQPVPAKVLGYGSANGCEALRIEIQKYLLRMRGLHCSPEQIVITTGSLHGFSLLSQLLLTNKENSYLIEDPLHTEIKRVLTATSRNYHCIPVDEYGMQTQLLPQSVTPSFVFVTPSHQYPTGGILPIQRRIELIEYARRKNCYIIEDDYDSEYRYGGTPVSTLYSLDSAHVIYVGTFSKVLFPSIRIGYMILPETLLDPALRLVRTHDYFVDNINQLTLARMLQTHDIDKHISITKKLYKKRHDYMLTLLSDTFRDTISIHGIHAGLHVMVTFHNRTFDNPTIACYEKNGVHLYPVWHHSDNPSYPKNSLVIGYSHLSETDMQYAIEKLAKADITV